MSAPKRAGRALPANSNPLRVRLDRFELDEANATLLREGEPVTLPPTPFAVLCALARQPATLLTKDVLLDNVWGHQFVSESVLKTAISDFRKALDDDARKPRFIETVSRRGYRFIAAAIAIPPAPSAGADAAEIGSPHLPSLTGREESLSRLRRAWNTACSGKRAIVWVRMPTECRPFADDSAGGAHYCSPMTSAQRTDMTSSQTLGVIGAGTMGIGIAQACVTAGLSARDIFELATRCRQPL